MVTVDASTRSQAAVDVLFAGDFAPTRSRRGLRRGDPSRATIRIPNAPLVDGASAPIAGLQYVPAEGTAGVAGMLISTPLDSAAAADAPERGTRARRRRDGRVVEHFEHSETFEGASDDAHAGEYLFTLPTEEGLLSCAGASEDASTVAAGTVDGALVAWRRRGGVRRFGEVRARGVGGRPGKVARRGRGGDAGGVRGARRGERERRRRGIGGRWSPRRQSPGPGAEGRCEKKSIVVFGAFGAPRAISKINVRQTADRRV